MNRPRTKQPKTGLGERLKKLREARKLTQPQLAHALHIAPGTVSRWEREAGSPQAEQLVTLMDFFYVSLDYLILGEESAKPTATLSPQLQEFLTTTAIGRYAREHKYLVKVLQALPQSTTIDTYRQVIVAIRTLIDEAEADAAPRTEQIKKPTK